MSDSIRCSFCSGVLFRAKGTVSLTIKCHRCKTINQINIISQKDSFRVPTKVDKSSKPEYTKAII